MDYDTDEHGVAACILPLMAVLQEHKEATPVRPVLDYRSLNEHIVCHPPIALSVRRNFAVGGRLERLACRALRT